jgi:methionyl aminopeptidase
LNAPNAYVAAMTQYMTVAPGDRVEPRNGVIKLHGPDGFAGMRAAGRLAAEILDAMVDHVVPGVTTDEIDAIVYRMAVDADIREAAARRSTT